MLCTRFNGILWVYINKILKNYNEALKIKKFEGCYKNSVDFQFLMGLIFMNNNRFTEAAKDFINV